METTKTIILNALYLFLLIASFLAMRDHPEYVLEKGWSTMLPVFFVFIYTLCKLLIALITSPEKSQLRKLLQEIEKNILEGGGITNEQHQRLEKLRKRFE